MDYGPRVRRMIEDGVVSYAPIVDSPLNRLRFGSRRPIDDIQFYAAIRFIAAFAYGGFGASNTATVADKLKRMSIESERVRRQRRDIRDINLPDNPRPFDLARARMVADGDVGGMSCRDDSGGAKSDFGLRMIANTFEQDIVAHALTPKQVSLLFDLLVNETSIAKIGHKWRQGSRSIRKAIIDSLDAYVAALIEHDLEFQAFVKETRQHWREEGEDDGETNDC